MGGKLSRAAKLPASRSIDNNLHSYDGLVLPEGWVIHKISVHSETLAVIAYYGMDIRCYVSRRGEILYELPIRDFSCSVVVIDVETVAVYTDVAVAVYAAGRFRYRFAADTRDGVWCCAGVLYTAQFHYELGREVVARRHKRCRPPGISPDLVVVFGKERSESGGRQYLGELQLLLDGFRDSLDEPELITVSASNHAMFVKKVFAFHSNSQRYCLDIDIDDTIYLSSGNNKVLQLI